MSDDAKKLSADDILGVNDLEVKEVAVPEWKGTVYLRVLPADEGLALSATMAGLPKESVSNALFLLLGATLVDENGRKLFTTDEQLAKLKTRSQKVLLRLQEEAMVLQGWKTSAAAGKDA
jgi:hypothetical protein